MIKSLKIVTSVLWLLLCPGIAPCYAISEFLFGIPECFTMSGYCTMLCNSWIDRLFRNQRDVTWPDIVSSRDPDLKIIKGINNFWPLQCQYFDSIDLANNSNKSYRPNFNFPNLIFDNFFWENNRFCICQVGDSTRLAVSFGHNYLGVLTKSWSWCRTQIVLILWWRLLKINKYIND